MAATGKIPNVVVGPAFNEFGGARVAPEEVVTNVTAVIRLVGLEITVVGGVHQVHQCAVTVGREEFIPLATPHHLEDIPARTAE